MTMNALNQSITSSLKGNFTPPYVSQLNNADEATKNFAQFYCYRLAKTFTDAFEAESFQQEMAFSNMAEAIGKVLTESNIGQTLQDNVTDMLNKENNKMTQSPVTSTSKAIRSYQQPPLLSQTNIIPTEMFEVNKWTL